MDRWFNLRFHRRGSVYSAIKWNFANDRCTLLFRLHVCIRCDTGTDDDRFPSGRNLVFSYSQYSYCAPKMERKKNKVHHCVSSSSLLYTECFPVFVHSILSGAIRLKIKVKLRYRHYAPYVEMPPRPVTFWYWKLCTHYADTELRISSSFDTPFLFVENILQIFITSKYVSNNNTTVLPRRGISSSMGVIFVFYIYIYNSQLWKS